MGIFDFLKKKDIKDSKPEALANEDKKPLDLYSEAIKNEQEEVVEEPKVIVMDTVVSAVSETEEAVAKISDSSASIETTEDAVDSGAIKELNPEGPAEENAVDPKYLGNLEHTQILFELIQTPRESRDEAWSAAFLDVLPTASFTCGEPQIVTGPDGYPYFQLFLPEPNKPFQCYVLEHMIPEFIMENGFGVVINPTDTHADWVLSYGDLVNYHVNKTFYTTEPTAFSKEVADEVITENEEVLVGQPTFEILPQTTRNVLNAYFKMNGVEQPKVFLMMRRTKDGNNASQDLVFNAVPQAFSDEHHYRQFMQSLGWFLPRHYAYVAMDENQMSDAFQEL